ncbi:hypothetical protein P6F26_10450 [Roseibacterium sp. SDUM158017]|uniref:hypothetical protein n=1 Tax=Roseicyclus salinarum TaxID=3036773 RepID=UPI0024155906|nr:hypothetical protein [Roseibacterium sp. SDUM158017]MDG4648864.1 hypothetical protein [Roseibacterium sp. SDUM158017]
MIRLMHGDAVAEIDPEVGNIPSWRVGGRVPLHAAPWRDEPEVQQDEDLPLVNRRLAGDFFCMPFGRDDVEGGPIHGLPANSRWEVVEEDVSHAGFRLLAHPRGATVTKRVQLVGPVLLQSHVIEGGAGEVTFAHHPMARMTEGGRLSFSPKRAVLTDPEPQYAGHNLWSVNQLRGDLHLDREDGGQWDLHDYPAGHAVEDFAILAEARGARLGWTVLMRNAEDDMLVVLKDARVMPVTMLWISNGGRDFSPWNARHTGVLGIEDGCAAGGIGLRGAIGDNRIKALGLPTTLGLGRRHVIAHALVSLPRPPGWSEVSAITLADGVLTLTERGGAQVSVPFPEGHFQ